MKYIDVCSGISAPTAAWKPLGWQALCFAEIEAAPRAVLAHHYPEVPLRGDFTEISGDEYGPVDLLVGGTPCQSFSIAGLRGGLGDDRGNLALEFARLADRARPRWVVWENVPGVLSSDGGRDFGSILGALAELGYGTAYSVLDAQHFGVPQRRRRVFVVGYLGDWRRAAAVLFERHSLSGHPAPRRDEREAATDRIARSVAIRGRDGTPQAELGDEVANAILTPNGGRAGVGCGAVLEEWPATVCPTLDTYFGDKMGLEDQHVFNQRGGKFVPVAYQTFGDGAAYETGAITAPLRTGTDNSASVVTVARFGLRRITPRECERLQGFPDDFTLVPNRGKPMADGPRYKMLGNSMAVPVLRWIGERIQMVDALASERAAA